MFAYELSNDGYWCDPQNVCDKQYNITNSPVNISVNDSEYFHGLPKYSIDIPLLLNKEFMEQMAQRLALIKLMRKIEEVQKVVEAKIDMFGSAGRRDEAKRAVQGELAGKYCDEVIPGQNKDILNRLNIFLQTPR